MVLRGLSKLQHGGEILTERHGKVCEGHIAPNLFPVTSEISRLTFFLVSNSDDSHRTKGMGIQSGWSTNCEQWSHAEKEGATDGTWGAVLPLTREEV